VLAARAPQWLESPPRRALAGRRPRVGFLSAFFRDGTAGRYFESWITGLPRERFDVGIHFLGSGNDALTARLRARADRFIEHGAELPSAVAPQIEAGAPDVVVYPELGMDATTFALAALRMAPRQLAGWGHPVTSGLPTIDAMLTAGAMEPEGAEVHYRERLIRLPGLGTRYARPARAARVDRGSLGLPADAPLFFFPQSLFKLHPDNDALVAEVLAATGARLVAFEGRHPRLTRAWRARLDRALEARGVPRDRVIVRPQVGHDDYLALCAACDAMLDSVIPFSSVIVLGVIVAVEDAYGIRVTKQMLARTLAVPASRFFRMRRSVSLLVSERADGSHGIVEGTYQSPILVQWQRSPRPARVLHATLTRLE